MDEAIIAVTAESVGRQEQPRATNFMESKSQSNGLTGSVGL